MIGGFLLIIILTIKDTKLDITLDKNSLNEASIKVKLNEADYQSKVAEKIKDHSKKAQVKGFRPGKVPTGLIKQMYGKSILVEEINHLVGHAIQDYIKDNEIQLLGEPLPNQQQVDSVDWDNQTEFEFEYSIGLVEDFTVDLSKKVKVKSLEIKVDKKVIDEAIDNVKLQFGTMTNPDVSEEGDTLFGTFTQTKGEIVHETTLDLNQLKKADAKKFIGKKKDDVIKIDLNKVFSDEGEKAALLGKTADEIQELDGAFTFTIKNVNRKEAAAMDQELFDKTFGPDAVKTEEEFRAKVSDTIGENYKRESDSWLIKSIQDKLIEKTSIPLPDTFLKEWLKVSGEGKVTDADIEKEYDQYTGQLRWNLITGKVAKDNDIKPEHEDVLAAARTMIEAQFGGSGLGQLTDQIDSFVDNYLKGENGDNYMKLAEQVQQEKVIEFIKSKIELKSESVDVEKFKKIVQN
jgi:trigger factor